MSVVREDSDAQSTETKVAIPLWRNRDYLILLSGKNISRLGSGISQLALPLLVLALTGSAVQAGLLGTVEVLPQLFFGLIAGALVDRWNRKRVMILCDTGRALILMAVGVGLIFKQLPLPLLYLLVALEGICAVFFDLAAASRLPHVVTKEQLPTAVAQDQTGMAVLSLLSPSLGGMLFSLATFLPFLADALSYIMSVISLCFLKTNFRHERVAGKLKLHLEIREGILWLWQRPLVRILAVLVSGVGFVAGGHTLLLIVLAQHSHASPAVIGVLFTVAGIGGVAGTLVAPLIQKRLSFGWIIISGSWMFVLLWPLYTVASSPLALGAVFAGLAFASVILDVALLSYLLLLIPDEMRGRVNSIINLLLLLARSAGVALTGFSLQWLGTLPTILFFGGCLLLLAIVSLLSTHLRAAHDLATTL
ncbi:MAG TPA: MFS transporter [Ktedonobacteraceae bacterium]|nr:MFS transporter [Ktedonobacteraceae bacterium]